MNPTHETVQHILAEISGRTAVTIDPDDSLSDLGLDSLDRLVLAVLVQQRCRRILSDEALIGLVTVADLTRQIEPQESGSPT
ncbi:acyl carrier protein [Micromonospora sp. 4G55]|uniref:acyl carrier protein n=1 Tax=Micromonospora sp. 4G55 TaxID=2806102 RepID=UPI001A54B3A2|nr:acyl carrier protein [Micromonospora sp. 4G55]MBM0256501.1 acyl carrier protein [Micromonospora sp. 4G55]